MPKIIDLIKAREESKTADPYVAFEYYPPRTEKGVANLYARLERMKLLEPLYVDFTWGAGGTTSDLTLELTVQSKKRFGMESNMHLTCTNMVADKITEALAGSEAGGIDNLLALRGDPPKGEEKWEATDGGFTCALDLVKHIRKETGDRFGISVAGYPEGHPETIKKVEDPSTMSDSEKGRSVTMEDGVYVCSDADYAKEIAYLKEKVDAGAEFIVTQMFFEASVFIAFVAACREAGIDCPIIPGIMLLQSAGGFTRMTAFCKSRVPQELKDRLEAVKEDAAAVRALGIEWGTAVCKELIASGVPGLHFYTLNLEKVTIGVLRELGLLPEGYDDRAKALKETQAAAKAAAAEEEKKKAAEAAAGDDDKDVAKGTILED